jgi:hypothetical protein
VVKCLEDWASNSKETQGFLILVENGMVELTGEFLVLKYSDQFSKNAIANAKKRLRDVSLRKEFQNAFKDAGIEI